MRKRFGGGTNRFELSGLLAAMVLAIIVLGVLFGPLIWANDPNDVDFKAKFAGPSRDHPLGADEFGRDLLSRILVGGRASLAGAVIVLIGATVLGFAIGATAGFAGGRIDALISRLIDALLALPTMIVALGLIGVLGKSFANLVLALIVTGWPWYARTIRGFVLAERNRDYLLAARSIGAGPPRIILRHLLPNISGPLIVLITTSLGGSMLSLTAFSFLGLGAQQPHPEWGAMINSARVFVQTEPQIVAIPGAAIGSVVIAINLLGDTVRDWLDPQQR